VTYQIHRFLFFWTNQGSSKIVVRYDNGFMTDLKENPSRIRAEGKRFTFLHAGCAAGFLEGCSFLLDNKIEHHDFHKNMSEELFKKWIEEQLAPALNQINDQVVVIMDNAAYHTMRADKSLNSNSRKGEMEEWLQR
jgi:hypothetical protein